MLQDRIFFGSASARISKTERQRSNSLAHQMTMQAEKQPSGPTMDLRCLNQVWESVNRFCREKPFGFCVTCTSSTAQGTRTCAFRHDLCFRTLACSLARMVFDNECWLPIGAVIRSNCEKVAENQCCCAVKPVVNCGRASKKPSLHAGWDRCSKLPEPLPVSIPCHHDWRHRAPIPVCSRRQVCRRCCASNF